MPRNPGAWGGGLVIKRSTCLLAVALTMAGCAVAPSPSTTGSIAWDGQGQDPNQPRIMRQRNRVVRAVPADPTAEENALLARLPPHSSELWAAERKIEADRDRRLSAKLTICRGCLASSGAELASQAARPLDPRVSEAR